MEGPSVNSSGNSQTFLDSVRDQIEIIYGDITKPETLEPALEGIDIVFHLTPLVTDWGLDLYLLR